MSDNESQKVTQIKRKLIIQQLLVRKAMMVPLSTQWVFPLSKEIVEKHHLRIPRKLSHHSKDNNARHLQRKSNKSEGCLKSLLNMQTSIYKNLSRYLQKCVQGKNLKNIILYENPVQTNISDPWKLDEYKELLEEHRAKRELVFVEMFEKMQTDTLSIMENIE